MDPNATLAELRSLVARATSLMDEDTGHPSFCEVPNGVVADMIERIEALDEWLGKGGFLPAEWRAKSAN
jgi:hypothetical protein